MEHKIFHLVNNPYASNNHSYALIPIARDKYYYRYYQLFANDFMVHGAYYSFKVKEINKLFYKVQFFLSYPCPENKYLIWKDLNGFSLGKYTEESYNEIIYNFKVKGIHYD